MMCARSVEMRWTVPTKNYHLTRKLNMSKPSGILKGKPHRYAEHGVNCLVKWDTCRGLPPRGHLSEVEKSPQGRQVTIEPPDLSL